MTVNPSTMRLGIASILVGLVGAYGVRVMMEEEPPPPEPKPVLRIVPLATGNLPVNRVIKMGDVGLYEKTDEEIAREGWPENLMMGEARQIIGRRVKRPIQQGQPFLITDVFLEGDKNTPAPKPGYRAVTLAVPMWEGGSAEAGDTVDIYFTSEYKKATEPGGRDIPSKTIKLIDSVEILDVWRPQLNALQAAVGYVEADPSFTLQVKVDDAPKISILRPYGRFSLYKRAPDDVAQVPEAKGLTLEELLGLEQEKPAAPPYGVWTTEYAYGRSMTAKRFPFRLPSPEQIAAYEAAVKEMQQKQAEAQGLPPAGDGQTSAAGGQPPSAAARPPSPAAGPRAPATSPPPPVPPPTVAAPAVESPFANESLTPPSSAPPPRTATQVPSPQVIPPSPSNAGATDPFTDDGEVLP